MAANCFKICVFSTPVSQAANIKGGKSSESFIRWEILIHRLFTSNSHRLPGYSQDDCCLPQKLEIIARVFGFFHINCQQKFFGKFLARFRKLQNGLSADFDQIIISRNTWRSPSVLLFCHYGIIVSDVEHVPAATSLLNIFLINQLQRSTMPVVPVY